MLAFHSCQDVGFVPALMHSSVPWPLMLLVGLAFRQSMISVMSLSILLVMCHYEATLIMYVLDGPVLLHSGWGVLLSYTPAYQMLY